MAKKVRTRRRVWVTLAVDLAADSPASDETFRSAAEALVGHLVGRHGKQCPVSFYGWPLGFEVRGHVVKFERVSGGG